MKNHDRAIPTGSQTVGPYFQIGLDYLAEASAEIHAGAGTIEIRGKVLDADGAPVPDAMLEFWSPGIGEISTSLASVNDGHPTGFKRTVTDVDGSFSLAIAKPTSLALEDERSQAPHMLVLVFARGLLRHLITRVYFEGEPGNTIDPVLQAVPAGRRATLIARLDDPGTSVYRWNVILQGEGETVFFAW